MISCWCVVNLNWSSQIWSNCCDTSPTFQEPHSCSSPFISRATSFTCWHSWGSAIHSPRGSCHSPPCRSVRISTRGWRGYVPGFTGQVFGKCWQLSVRELTLMNITGLWYLVPNIYSLLWFIYTIMFIASIFIVYVIYYNNYDGVLKLCLFPLVTT